MSSLLAHMDTNHVTLKELAQIQTPESTKTWSPTPHIDVIDGIKTAAKEAGWEFKAKSPKDRFKIAITPNGAKMFGITDLIVPGLNLPDGNEFGMSIGFRNSHNKTMALRFAMGTNVFVCDNMCMFGDFFVNREHTKNISVIEAATRAFEVFPKAANQLADRFSALQEIPVTLENGVYVLSEAVKRGALPIVDFMDARESLIRAYEVDAARPEQLKDDEGVIAHGRTAWGVFQAVTEQWKDRSMMSLPKFSHNLNDLINDHFDIQTEAAEA